MGHRAAIYCRVSTADQSCERQEFDLRAFAGRAGYDVVGIFKETGSGTKLDRAERKKVLALAQSRQIDAILVTELSRWGRSTLDLLNTLRELENWKVSGHCCKVSDEAAFCLIQRPYISKTLLT
ncbi:recombinase family protein, partial [Klebsiella pneumoniae]